VVFKLEERGRTDWRSGKIAASTKVPPIVIEEPTATFGPSIPHLFFELLSANCAWTGKGEVE